MKNILALIGLLVVGFAAVGWYCGWYKLSVGKSTDGNLQINTQVDTKKVADDSTAFFDKMGKMIGDRAEQGKPASAPGATPGPGGTGKEAFSGGWLTAPVKPQTTPAAPPPPAKNPTNPKTGANR